MYSDVRGSRCWLQEQSMNRKRDEIREARSEQLYMIFASLCLAAAGGTAILLAPEAYKPAMTVLGWGFILLAMAIAGVISYKRSGFRIILLPAVIYILAGTSLLFIVYKAEGLVETLANFKKIPGLESYSATEWHASDMWLTIAFPVVFPFLFGYVLLLFVYALLTSILIICFNALLSVLTRLLDALANTVYLMLRASRWLVNAVVSIWNAIAQPIMTIIDWLLSLVLTATRWIVNAIVATWNGITRPIKAVFAWLLSLIRTAAQWVLDVFMDIWNGLTRPIIDFMAWLISSIVDAWLWIARAVSMVWNGITRPVRAFLIWIVSSIFSAWVWIARSVLMLWRGITRPIKAFLIWITSTIASVWRWTVKVVSAV